MLTVKVRKLSGWVKRLTDVLIFFQGTKELRGWASAWDTVYLAPSHWDDERVLAHEIMHIKQMQRHGRYWFMVLYAYESARRGYRNNKFEVEARETSVKVAMEGVKLERVG